MGRQLGAEHSQRLESYFQSIPGVQLVACSTVANAKALLKSAIRSDNPVIFFEHVLLYNVKGMTLISSGALIPELQFNSANVWVFLNKWQLS